MQRFKERIEVERRVFGENPSQLLSPLSPLNLSCISLCLCGSSVAGGAISPLADRSEGGIVVGFVADVGDVFDMLERAVRADNEGRAR